MNQAALDRYANCIDVRIIWYCDMGVHTVWHIHRRMVNDTGEEDWADSYDPYGVYPHSAHREEDIIEDVLRSAGRLHYMFDPTELEHFIIGCWNNGARDLAHIAEQAIEFQRGRGYITSGINGNMVANVFTKVGLIVRVSRA
jgi:hypothetical protein